MAAPSWNGLSDFDDPSRQAHRQPGNQSGDIGVKQWGQIDVKDTARNCIDINHAGSSSCTRSTYLLCIARSLNSLHLIDWIRKVVGWIVGKNPAHQQDPRKKNYPNRAVACHGMG